MVRDPRNPLGRYILDGEEPIPVYGDILAPEGLAWARWMEVHANRLVAQDYLGEDQEILLSTMFLALDHRFWGDGPPLLFETMISGPYGWGDYQVRYATWDDAWAGHHAQLKRMQEDWERLGSVTTSSASHATNGDEEA